MATCSTIVSVGTYYRYVNFTRREFVSLHDLRDGGDKENAVLYCAPALAWLLVWPHVLGDSYRGRWHRDLREQADEVRVVRDSVYDFLDMEDNGFLNISAGVLQSMREQCPEQVEDYQPRHRVRLVQRVPVPVATHELAEQTSASCSCGWRVGPIFGEARERVLELAVSEHLNSA